MQTRRWAPHSLRGRLTVVVVLGSLLASAVALVLLYVVLDAQLRGAVDADLESRIVDVVAEARTAQSPVLDDPYAQVVDDRGEVVLASPGAPESSVLTSVQLDAARQHLILLQGQVPGLPGTARLAAEAVPGTDLVAIVGTSLAGVEAANGRLVVVLGLAMPAVVLVLVLLARWAVAASLRPVGALTERAANISTAGSEERLPVPEGEDEISDLARTLNAMLDRLRTSFEHERAFVDDASHELRTPIAVLRGELELALMDRDPEHMRRSVEIAQAEAEHLSNLATDLLVLARERTGALALDRRQVDLHDLAERATARLRPLLAAALEVRGERARAAVDEGRLEQVITNLVTNSAEAGAAHVWVDISETGSRAVIEVRDDGPGFPADLRPAAFDRFSRGDRARTRPPTGRNGGTGAGLGLAISAAIVRAHGGEISIADNNDQGACVRVELPR
jgi:two-component system OmpR family sensor kinase